MTQLVEPLTILPMPPDFQPGGFACGQSDVDEYLQKHAVNDQHAGVTRSYLVRDGDEVVAYISVCCDHIHLRQEERPPEAHQRGAPGLKIGLMGVRQDYRGRKFSGKTIGSWLILWAIGLARDLAPVVGLRYVTLDALRDDKLVAWYEKNGFIKTEGEEHKRRLVKSAGSKKYKNKELDAMDDEMQHVPMRFDIQLVAATAASAGGGASAAAAVIEGA